MKRFIYLLATVIITFSCINVNIVEAHALTHEELREWLRENGTRVSGGGTRTDLSICPGEITPDNSTSSSSSTTPTEAKPVEVPKQPMHEHSYIETVTTEPTCIEEGVKTFTCSCGDKYTEPI